MQLPVLLCACIRRANVPAPPALGAAPLRRLDPSATARQVADVLKTDGAVVLERYRSSEAVAAALQELEAGRMEGSSVRMGASTQLWKWPLDAEKEPNTKALESDKLIMDVAEELRQVHGLGSDSCIGNEVRLLILAPGTPAGDLHRDVVDTTDVPLERPLQWGLNAIWAADDFTEENGATRFVVGSHSGQLPQGSWKGDHLEAEPLAQVASMPAGSVVLYYASTLHGSSESRVETSRTGINFNYAFVDAAGGRPHGWGW
ncbi:unnamed protein product [Polarella glacialis]|uniref:Phytanoyl-CoA dioxygenase n=1 Tax=Polarella glacialis TaxID=89957 RepID=A0A813H960_POLGL|nr:unnamed protein product [Polarella glacialis]